MISPDLLNFACELERNSNRTWFDKRNADYKAMEAVFEQSVKGLALDIAAFDDSSGPYLCGENLVKVPHCAARL